MTADKPEGRTMSRYAAKVAKRERERVLGEIETFGASLLIDAHASSSMPGQSLMARYLLKTHAELTQVIAKLRAEP